MSDTQINGVSLQEYFKKKTDNNSQKLREGVNMSKMSNNNLNHSFTPLYDLSMSQNDSVMLSKLQVNQSDLLNMSDINTAQKQIIRNQNIQREFNKMKLGSDNSRDKIESATHVLINSTMRSAL